MTTAPGSLSRRLLLLTAALLLAAPVALAQPPEEGFQFERITPPIAPKGSKPEITEVFNFKCPHCFHLHPHLMEWRKKNESRFDFPSVPIFWGEQTDLPLRAYFTAEAMGKGEVMKDLIFKAQFDRKINIEDEKIMADLAKEAGLDVQKFNASLRSFGISGKVARSLALAKAYGAASTPTLVINGRYRVNPTHANGDWNKMFEIAEFLANRKD